MSGRRLAIIWLAAALAACAERAPAIDDAYGYLPLIDGGPAVAYFTLRNPGDQSLAIAAIECPLFGRAELHETRIADGVSRMRRLDNAVIEPGSELALRPGGKHLMLMDPTARIPAGSICPLVIHFADGSYVAADVSLSERDTGGSGQ